MPIAVICKPSANSIQVSIRSASAISLPVSITPRCPRCGSRLYALRANKPGIGSAGETALPFGYCWECEGVFRVTVELETLKPRDAEAWQTIICSLDLLCHSSGVNDSWCQIIHELARSVDVRAL